MRFNFKRTMLMVVFCAMLLVSCGSPNSLNKKATEIAKSFYTEYLNAYAKKDAKKLLSIKKNYMTETLVDEVDIRTKQLEADIVIGSVDSTNMLNKMTITDGDDDEWAIVTFDMIEEEGKPYHINEVKIHFRDVDKSRLIDTLDLTIYDVDEDGDKVKNEYKTRWAYKEELSEEDKAEMKSAKEYFEELEGTISTN